MRDVSRWMDFDVHTDLKNKSNQYRITIELENEVSSHAREAAIVLTGALVRNYHSKLYPDISTDAELAEMVKGKLNHWIPQEAESKFVVKGITIAPKRVKGRA